MTTPSSVSRLGALAALALALSACAGSPPDPADDSPAASSSSTEPPAPTASRVSEDVIRAAPPSPPSGDGLRPEPEDAFDDQPDAYDEDCQNSEGTEVLTCSYGDEDADTTVALVGDSKALQWISALDEIATDRGWHVVTMTKSTCTWADAYVSSDQRPNTECWSWGQQAKDDVLDLDPDLVVTSFGHNMAAPDDSSTDFSRGALVDGLVTMWEAVGAEDIPVAALSDTPNSGAIESVPDCVAEHRDDTDACTIEESEGIGTPAMREAVKRVPTATLVDLTDVVCPDGTCRPVFGDVLVQRDGSHVTDTFVRTVAPALDAPLAELVGSST